jgi:methyl-accepting chemotaxis protein
MSDQSTSVSPRTIGKLRIHLVLTSLTVTAAFAAVIALSIFLPLAAQLQRSPVDAEASVGLAEHFLFLHAALWPLIFLSLVSCIVSSTVLYERMRAPLKRFIQCFEIIGAGSVPEPVGIRSWDYLADESAALNRMIEQLRQQAAERKEAADRLYEILGDLSAQGIGAETIDELREVAKARPAA